MKSAAGKSPYGTEKARRTRGAMWKRRDRLVRPARAAAGGERNGPKFMPAPNKFSPLSKRAIRGSGPQPRGSLGTFHPWKVPRPGAKYPPSFSENRSHGTGKRQTSGVAPYARQMKCSANWPDGASGPTGYGERMLCVVGAAPCGRPPDRFMQHDIRIRWTATVLGKKEPPVRFIRTGGTG